MITLKTTALAIAKPEVAKAVLDDLLKKQPAQVCVCVCVCVCDCVCVTVCDCVCVTVCV
jgi:hypothetical protein